MACLKGIDGFKSYRHHKNNANWCQIQPKHNGSWNFKYKRLPNYDNNIDEEMQEKSSNTKEAFGFYCPQSNRFYYVENREVYV